MTKDRVCATDTGLPIARIPQYRSMYTSGRVDDAFEKIVQIKALARVGRCAADSDMSVDLGAVGWEGMFEVIHRLCDEIYGELDDLHCRHRIGFYAKMGKNPDADS
ncbi:hypothetical protein I5535_03195 [Rhodobacteraceae bacterium F11138]|nr:hypothetical protein [Rhodobacteraceae bacterium F11138]